LNGTVEAIVVIVWKRLMNAAFELPRAPAAGATASPVRAMAAAANAAAIRGTVALTCSFPPERIGYQVPGGRQPGTLAQPQTLAAAPHRTGADGRRFDGWRTRRSPARWGRLTAPTPGRRAARIWRSLS